VARRTVDIVVAAVALALLSPVLAVLALLVRIRLDSPVLFRQQRAGLGGEPFKLLKFRTMADGRDSSGTLLPDGRRLAPFGMRLRSLSLDELPELWNIMKGDMSFIGPRPLPTAYLPRYTLTEHRRHEVRPGLTGWAQVNGRNSVGWDQRLAMDVWYVDHRSLWLDLRIMAKSVGTVVARSGISADGQATMAELRPELGSPRLTDESRPHPPRWT